MKKMLLAFWMCGFGLLCGCTPGAVQSIRLTPSATCEYPRGEKFVEAEAAGNEVQEQYVDTITAGGDSLRIFVGLHEFPDYIEANVEIVNTSRTDFTFTPGNFALLDGSRMAFLPVEASVVANEMLLNINEIPAYQPKYNYYVQSSAYGTANTQYLGGGQYHTTYSGTGTSTVTAQEDPYNALGYSIGALFAEAANDKVRACARKVYERGIGISADLMARSRGAFNVYWRNRTGKTYPVRFLVKDTAIEFSYEKPQRAASPRSSGPQPTGVLAD
jgi:hypothetical protein